MGCCPPTNKTNGFPTLNLLSSIPQRTTLQTKSQLDHPAKQNYQQQSLIRTTPVLVKMRSITFIITFMAMMFFYVLCDALPYEASLPALSDNVTSTNTSISRAIDPNSINSVPNLNHDVFKNKNRCYYTDVSETWSDVGGKHSQFVHDAVYHMCDVIATFASNTGLKKDDIVSDGLSSHL